MKNYLLVTEFTRHEMYVQCNIYGFHVTKYATQREYMLLIISLSLKP